MTSLAVWMHGEQIGLLSQDRRGTLSFRYSDLTLAAGFGRPLVSVAMPTIDRAYVGDAVHAFFNGLLPEGEARQIIAYDLGLKDDPFSLLEALGRDCAGALVLLPEGEHLPEDGEPESISEHDVGERLAKLRFHPLGVDQRIRVSLAGMQEKLLLARLEQGWGLPVNGAPSTHILKPASQNLSDSIANEGLCLRIAGYLGVRAAHVELQTFAGISALVIERYDRTPTDGRQPVSRLHQEDMCQAHGLDGRAKYEESGGPSLRQIADLLDRWSTVGEKMHLLDLITVNTLIGNADAHGKNVGIVHGLDGEIRLAPAYDLLSTVYYSNVSTIAGMFVNGLTDINAIGRDDLVAEATSWGVATNRATERVEALLDGAEEAIITAAQDMNAPVALRDLVLARAQSL